MHFGCNVHHYPEVANDVHGMDIVRVFGTGQQAMVPAGMLQLLSIRPDPQKLLAGALDGEIKSQVSSLPKGSLLTAWHEANVNTAAQPGLPPKTAREVHRYMHKLVASMGVEVGYGIVLLQGRPDVLASYTVTGMDWYGLDLYDFGGTTDPSDVMDRCFAAMPAGPRLIAETNSAQAPHRPAWFREVYDWLAAHQAIAMLTFWNPAGTLSGPWIEDPATIYALNRISKDAQSNDPQ
jgi:hypothetical protein